MTKNEYRKVLIDFEIYSTEVFLENKEYPKEYYVWYDMLISFSRNKRNNIMYLKVEGEIPVALIEYIEKKYPQNKILSLYPKNDESIKNCNVVLINNLKDLRIFLKESRNYWIQIENVEEEMLYLDEQAQRKKLIP